jgi:hypothetical protein
MPAPICKRRKLAKSSPTGAFSPFTGRRWRQPDEGQRRRLEIEIKAEGLAFNTFK